MRLVLSCAALAASLLVAPATIGAQQTPAFPAYDVEYYDSQYHWAEQVGQSRGFCDEYGASSYMEWGYQTAHPRNQVKVADCPIRW